MRLFCFDPVRSGRNVGGGGGAPKAQHGRLIASWDSVRSCGTASERIARLAEQVREARCNRQFVLGCLQYATCNFAGGNVEDHKWEPLPAATTTTTAATPRAPATRAAEEQEIAVLQAQLKEIPSSEVEMSTIRTLNQYLLKQPFPRATTPQDPDLLFRIFTPNSNTVHSDLLGFRCSSTAPCPPELEAATLRECACLSGDAFVAHLERSEPSAFISLSESPAGLMNFIHGKWHLDLPDEVRIAVFNVRMMRKLHVLFDRSTEIEKHLGLRRVLFVTPSHWIAHRWIPVEAIVGYLTLSQFRETCYFMGVISNGERIE